MKEAAGEANITVVTIILIGVIVAIATPLITTMMNNTAKRSCCTNYGGVMENGKCMVTSATGTKTQVQDANYWDANTKSCK